MFYKAVLNGNCQGQDIKNILYYRDGVGFTWLNPLFGGSETLAGNIVQEIWPKLKVVLPNDYQLESVDVYPHNDAFELTTQMPFSLAVNELGLQASQHAGLSQVMNLKFNLEATGILNGVFPPRRGYIALGPVPSTWIQEDGMFTQAVVDGGEIGEICVALAQDLLFVVPSPGSFYPIRVKHNRALGGLIKWLSFADVNNVRPVRKASFRRSRMPEG